jgi:2,5-diamino-6-(ribosylamino)-4(3H)-pyrimidinone 5'-phosphate reductase
MFIFSNLATSLDGKIATENRGVLPLGTPEDFKRVLLLRKKADAILTGASTLRTYRKPNLVSGRTPWNVILSSTLEGISPRWPFFTHEGTRRILFVDPKTPTKTLRAFESRSEIICISPRKPPGTQIVSHLEKKGVKSLLVEGGGGTMWEFASHNLIDEYHVTLTPRILGGRDAPTLVDGKGFAPKEILNLSLQRCKVVGDEIFLTYVKKRKRGIRNPGDKFLDP